jgi:peptidoglycan/xylan/chitin deacetylase (PgdA/CDA1 family)
MFHRFTDAPQKQVDTNGVISAQYLDRLLCYIRKSGPEIIALRDVPRAIAEGRRFVCLTMDDGYRSNAEIALPVLRRHNAPASIFVPSSILDRTIDAWWLQVEELARLQAHPRAAYENMLMEIAEKPEALALLRKSFVARQEELNDRYFLSAAEVVALDRDPLIEIGGHTITHPQLKGLSDHEAVREISQNKKDLEILLGRDVDSFAYPFGDAQACGAREYALASKAGYKVAVTTREGNIFPAHAAHMTALPRYSVRELPDKLAVFDMQISGAYRALKSCFGSEFITV